MCLLGTTTISWGIDWAFSNTSERTSDHTWWHFKALYPGSWPPREEHWPWDWSNIDDDPLLSVYRLKHCSRKLGRCQEKWCARVTTRCLHDGLVPSWWMLPYSWTSLWMRMTWDPFGRDGTPFLMTTSCPSLMMSPWWGLGWWRGVGSWIYLDKEGLLDHCTPCWWGDGLEWGALMWLIFCTLLMDIFTFGWRCHLWKPFYSHLWAKKRLTLMLYHYESCPLG